MPVVLLEALIRATVAHISGQEYRELARTDPDRTWEPWDGVLVEKPLMSGCRMSDVMRLPETNSPLLIAISVTSLHRLKDPLHLFHTPEFIYLSRGCSHSGRSDDCGRGSDASRAIALGRLEKGSRMGRRVMMTAAVLLTLVLGAVGSPRASVAAQDATPDAVSGSFPRMVDIGGRSLLLDCQGEGSPTVVLEAGRFPSTAWSAVLSGASQFTRVCRYDRANTGSSDPAPLPRTGQDIVADLHALLTAANVPGPYVLVGESLGGLFLRLYAAAYPDEVAGMVLAEAIHEETFTAQGLLIAPEDMAETIRLDTEGGDPEGIWTAEDIPITFDQMRAARDAAPLKPMPLVILASGRRRTSRIPRTRRHLTLSGGRWR